MPHDRGGFTLIEMLGVLAIMALLSAAATVLLSGSRHAADLRDAMGQFQQADTAIRTFARSGDRSSSMLISVANGRLARGDENESTALGNLPGDVKIERIRTASTTIDFGTARIAFNLRGGSDTYAVKLASTSSQKQWILFSGLTGQMLEVTDDEIDALFQEISTGPGADAH